MSAENPVEKSLPDLPVVDLLAFGAHPDDVEVGAGGLLIQSGEAGYRLGVVDLTRGEMGSKGDADRRAKEALEAAREYGPRFRSNLDRGDAHLRDDIETAKDLARILRQTRPRLILAPDPEDRHPDHRAAAKLVRRARFYAALVKMDLGTTPYSGGRLLFYAINEWRPPQIVIDVGQVYDRKKRAILAFQSQFGASPLPIDRGYFDSQDYLAQFEARARFFGSFTGVAFGEGYFFDRGAVPVADPIPTLGRTMV